MRGGTVRNHVAFGNTELSAWFDKTTRGLALKKESDALVQQGKWSDAEMKYREASEQNPQNAGGLRTCGYYRAKAGQWKEAAADYSKAIEYLPADHLNYHELAPLLVQSSDLQAYRQLCAQALAQFGGTTDPVIAERIAKVCLLWPSSGVDLKASAALAETAVEVGNSNSVLAWFQCVKGLAEYRQGHFAGAADWMGKVLINPGNPFLESHALLVLAMAQYQLRQAGQARASFAKAVTFQGTKLPKLENGDTGWDWVNLLIERALMKEATELIQKPLNGSTFRASVKGGKKFLSDFLKGSESRSDKSITLICLLADKKSGLTGS
jgi:tetratricopeptide (TPR) repeat protein